MKRTFKEILYKFVMFSLTSGAGTIVDLGLHWLLSRFVFAGNYWGSFWIAPVISCEAAVFVNFFIAFYFVWRERLTYHGPRAFWRHFAAYNAVGFGAFVIKFAAMQGLHFLFVWWNLGIDPTFEPVLCNLIGLCFSGLFNFVMNEFVVFQKKDKNQ